MSDRLGAIEYHERTKHSPRSVREGGHRLDFDTKPTPYKIYEDRPMRSLTDVPPVEYPALAAVAEPTPNGVLERRSGQSTEPTADLETVSTLCRYAAGVTRTIERQGRAHEFRAAAATGALYHVDLYVVCDDLGVGDLALEAGVYHYDPRDESLDVVREGEYRGPLARASEHEAIADAPLSIVATSTWWRNAWKYRERTFRHGFWDSGTILSNLLAVAHALDYRAEIVTGFADETVADLLGLDPAREAPLELVAIGGGAGDTVSEPPAIDPIDPDTAPFAADETDVPLIHEAWAAGVLESGSDAAAWRDGRPSGAIGTRGSGQDADDTSHGGGAISLEPVDHETASSRPLSATIERRGSCREYARESISFRKLSTILDRAVRGVPMDVRREADPPLAFTDCYLLVNAVDGLEAGTYHLHATEGDHRLERLRTGHFREEAGHLALDQRLGADAAVCVYFLSDLEEIVEAFGDRGYRVAQLEAALTAGRLYLATYAHRDLGGTGLTFYDDLVTDFFAPRAAGKTPLFLYTMGRPA